MPDNARLIGNLRDQMRSQWSWRARGAGEPEVASTGQHNAVFNL